MTALLAGLIGKRAASVIGGVLGFIIPVPLILILAALAWVHFDKSSAVRRAVDNAVAELVAGAEIATLRAQIAAEREIAARLADTVAERDRRLRAEREALETLNGHLAALRAENEIINNDLDDLLSRPVRSDCTVGTDFLDRLRAR